MYANCEDIIQATKQRVQKHSYYVTIDDEIDYDESSILKDSFHLDFASDCGSAIKIGQAYIGTLSLTIVDPDANILNMKGKPIEAHFSIKDAKNYGYGLAMGIFTIKEIRLTNDGIYIKAYDDVKKLDTHVKLDENMHGTPYEFVSNACKAVGIKLKTTQNQFSKFVNGDVDLTLNPINTIETHLDLLKWIAQTTCTNIRGSSQGLEFVAFNNTVVDTIDTDHRFKGSSFPGTRTYYTGLSCANVDDITTSYYGTTDDNALTYNLGFNPFLQAEDKDTLRTNILNGITNINFATFECTIMEDPVLQVMDVVKCTGGQANENYLYCITKISIHFCHGMTISGAGKDISLASKYSKSNKNLIGLFGLSHNTGSNNTSSDNTSSTDTSQSDDPAPQTAVSNFDAYMFESVKALELHAFYGKALTVNFTATKDTKVCMIAAGNVEFTPAKEEKSITGQATIEVPISGSESTDTQTIEVPITYQDDVPGESLAALSINNSIIEESAYTFTLHKGINHTISFASYEVTAGTKYTLCFELSLEDSGKASLVETGAKLMLFGDNLEGVTMS